MASTRNLDSWLGYISEQHTEVIDMGLQRFNQVLDQLQPHEPASTVITVAGTNGKGTTCRMIEALLLQSGYRVGTTLSPHIWRFNERIRLHGHDAGDDEICAAFAAIDEARGDLALTYFEFSALAALYAEYRALSNEPSHAPLGALRRAMHFLQARHRMGIKPQTSHRRSPRSGRACAAQPGCATRSG